MAANATPAAPRLVLGSDGPVVVVSARVAAYLNRHAGLSNYRIQHRGADAEVDATLLALAVVGAAWRGSATGTRDAAIPELGTGSHWVGSRGAAARLGITDRAVRRAIAHEKLKAVRSGRAWRIAVEDLEHFRASRSSEGNP